MISHLGSRVLHVDSGGEYRGGQRQLYLLALEQRTGLWEPLVVSQPRSRLVQRLRGRGIASAGVRMRGIWDIAAARRLRRILRAWAPRVVHAHDLRSLSIAHAALLGMHPVALVLTCRTIPATHGTITRVGSRVDRFIAPNHAVRRFLTGTGVSTSRITVIPPGVAVGTPRHPRHWRDECRWPADSVVCGVIGASGTRAASRFRAILTQLSNSCRERLRLVILGGPPLGGTRIAGTSSFGTGFVDDMGAALAGCDLLCSLSGAESMNTSLLDALQLGVPFVAFDSGGAADFVESGRGGLLVPSGDAVAFGVAISSLVESELLRQKVGSHGPARAANFSVHMAAESTERCYHAALESRRAPIRKGASA